MCVLTSATFQGTLPFMAIQLHRDQTAVHLPIYDLQSFFFVFIWICILYEAPGQACREMPEVLTGWVCREGHQRIADLKTSHVVQSTMFHNRLGSAFKPYFKDLVEFADNFRSEVFGSGTLMPELPTATSAHDKVINLVSEELQRMQAQQSNFHLSQAMKGLQLQDSGKNNGNGNEPEPTIPRRTPRDTTKTQAKIRRALTTYLG